ncbi:tetratricopeptide repeat protein [Litoribrevibacter euphylliae]|uniref:Tetratricopeptide repeat protein n=1 Tax=Litoribrevibacter euphylliae TaxID=1834034 RepID=A0ABV7HA36_9GAMM
MVLKQFINKLFNRGASEQAPPEALLTEQQRTKLNTTFIERLAELEDPQARYDLAIQFSEKGATQALYTLGVFYEQGDGQKTYPELAAECYWRAGKFDIAEAQYNLGLLYAQGQLGQVDLVSAHYWFTEATKQNLAQAQFNLATFYEDGLGCVEDLKKAFELYQTAANQGFITAWHNLALMHYSGKGTQRNPITAYAWVLLAAKAGLKEAQETEPVFTEELKSEQILAGKTLLEELQQEFKAFLPSNESTTTQATDNKNDDDDNFYEVK